MNTRIIIHVDVNNAFLSWTSVFLLKNNYKKDIRNTYAIIAGDAEKRRGIVLAKSPLSKKKGVKTGEAIWEARKKCPYLDIYKPSFDIYKEYSDLMYNYLLKYSDKIERYSIDECFIDYTNSYNLFGDPVKLAYKIKDDIKHNFGFTVNVGIGNNKLTAKMASDFEKPDRVHTLFDEEIEKKLWPLPAKDLFMIGKKTTLKLTELNINTIYELAHTSKDVLTYHFKKMGTLMWEYANGIDNSEVEYMRSDPKSISASTVLPYNYSDIKEINKILQTLVSEVGEKLRKKMMYGNTIFIWIKYSNFEKFSKQIKLDNSVNTDNDIYNYAKDLFLKNWTEEKIRALCVGITNLTKDNQVQFSLFNNYIKEEKNEKLQKVMDDINKKYGPNSIIYANKFKDN